MHPHPQIPLPRKIYGVTLLLLLYWFVLQVHDSDNDQLYRLQQNICKQ